MYYYGNMVIMVIKLDELIGESIINNENQTQQ